MNVRHRQSLAKPKFFRSPMGQIVYIRLLDEFCKVHNLSVRQMRKLARGKIEEHRYWTLVLSGHKKNEE